MHHIFTFRWVAVHYSGLQCIVLHHNVLQCTTVHCSAIHYSALQCRPPPAGWEVTGKAGDGGRLPTDPQSTLYITTSFIKPPLQDPQSTIQDPFHKPQSMIHSTIHNPRYNPQSTIQLTDPQSTVYIRTSFFKPPLQDPLWPPDLYHLGSTTQNP